MKKTHYIALIILIFASCQKLEKHPKPETLLTEDKMVVVLTDMALLKAMKSLEKSSLEESGIDPLDYLCNKHDVDPILFKSNLEYYSNDPEVYQKLYTRVDDTLEAKKLKVESFISRSMEAKMDSIGFEKDSLKIKKDSLVTKIK